MRPRVAAQAFPESDRRPHRDAACAGARAAAVVVRAAVVRELCNVARGVQPGTDRWADVADGVLEVSHANHAYGVGARRVEQGDPRCALADERKCQHPNSHRLLAKDATGPRWRSDRSILWVELLKVASHGRAEGRTRTIRSNRPGRRRATTTSWWLVCAEHVDAPSLPPVTPSISVNNWLTVPRAAELRIWLRFWPRASISSRKNTIGCVGTGGREDLVKVALALPDVHVQHVSQGDRQEVRAHLASDCASDECLATPWRSIEKQPTFEGLPVQLDELGVAHRRKDGRLQAGLDLLHAAHVREPQSSAFHV